MLSRLKSTQLTSEPVDDWSKPPAVSATVPAFTNSTVGVHGSRDMAARPCVSACGAGRGERASSTGLPVSAAATWAAAVPAARMLAFRSAMAACRALATVWAPLEVSTLTSVTDAPVPAPRPPS